MSEEKFETSKQSGLHYQFNLLVGEWEGTTRVWFEADKLADESPTDGTMRSILDGRFILHEHKGSFDGKPVEGVAIYGNSLGSNRYQSAWVDSFHMGTGIMFSETADTDTSVFSVLGHYGSPGNDELWGWRTEIEMPERIRL